MTASLPEVTICLEQACCEMSCLIFYIFSQTPQICFVSDTKLSSLKSLPFEIGFELDSWNCSITLFVTLSAIYKTTQKRIGGQYDCHYYG